jgi:hypothetical protein
LRKFKMCRICLRNRALAGEVTGLIKAQHRSVIDLTEPPGWARQAGRSTKRVSTHAGE